MALYLGKKAVKINLNGIAYSLELFSALPTITDIILSSSDDGLLKDFNGLYLALKSDNTLLSLDNYVLTDANGLRIIFKESE